MSATPFTRRWRDLLRFSARSVRRASWAVGSWLLWVVQRLTLAARPEEPALRSLPPCPRVLIFGWFGTETVGDRAILVECCRLLEDALDQPCFRVASSDPRRTEETVATLALGARVVGMNWRQLAWADLVVVGGGPMMDDSAMFSWWCSLLAARWLRRPSVLLGVGVHPLRAAGTARAVRSMAEIASVVALREAAGPGGPCGPRVRTFVDPSLYAPPPAPRRRPPEAGLRLAANLRPWPIAFYGGPWQDYGHSWARFVDQFLTAVAELMRNGVVGHVTFLPMHDAAPDDDRLIYPEIATRLRELEVAPERITFVVDLPTPNAAARLLADSDAFVGMRFHANALAALAGTPGLGLDYTSGGGKVTRLYEALGCPERALTLDRVTAPAVSAFLRDVRECWPQYHESVVRGLTRLREGRGDLVAWLSELQGSA